MFRYAAVATNITGDAISYDLSLAPEGLTIDPENGLVAFQPTIDQVGTHEVILRATDASGSISLQSFIITVEAPNTAPVITSTAPAVGFVGATFVYQVLAQDAELDSLAISLADAPAGATINSNGRIEFSAAAAGDFDFTVDVSDGQGNTTSQSFSILVAADAPPATPFAIDSARTQIGLGQTYLSSIAGADALGRPLEFSLVSGPDGFEVESDGSLQFTPTVIGQQAVELLATTADGESETVSFEIEVVGQPVITTPSIVSQPALSATIGNEYQYDLEVVDATGVLLSFEILEGPVGASIDPDNGTLRFTPQADQLGETDFEIEVVNVDGQSVTQTFTLNVSRFGGPPLIVSTPPTEVNIGQTFLYTVDAVDPEDDPLTFSLLQAPDGVTINETTGEISFTPIASQVGQQAIAIQVSDGLGGATTQAFAILVNDGVFNAAPVITSEAPLFTAVGADYSYQIEATDPEGTALSFEVSQGPAGLTVSDTGLVTFTPAEGQTGQFVVTLRVTDEGGAASLESYLLDVLAENRAPVINSTPPVEVVQGVTFRYDVLVSDADLDPITFELINAPQGATINAFGQIVLETDDFELGTFEFEVRASDPRGGEATQTFSIELVADTIAPSLTLIESPNDDAINVLPNNSPFTLFVRANDNVGVASLTLSVNGEDTPLDANGTAQFTFEDFGFGTIEAVATAVDTSGNVTTATNSFNFDFPQGFTGEDGQTLPTAVISTPGPSDTIFGFASIVGTADAENFAAFELSYRKINETTFTTIVRGDTPVVDGELGVFDTTLLNNDEYVLRLAVSDADGVTNIVEQNVGVGGNLKLGNFQLEFTDLVVPVAGIPLEITRVYDSLQADTEFDFGFGTRLEFRDTNLQVGLPSSGLEDIGIYTAFRPGCLLYTSPSPRDRTRSRMPSSA